MSIALVARECGISKDSLRAWERRYGFPAPQRDAHGDRLYPPEQVARLRQVKRLLDGGMRPSRALALDDAERRALLHAEQDALPSAVDPAVEALLRTDLPALRRELAALLAGAGLLKFVCDNVARLNQDVGAAWADGRLSVAQEHLYTEEMSRLLRGALQALPQGTARPRTLLGTLAGEPHALGLLMAEVVIRVSGGEAVNLGTELPVDELASAAAALDCEAIGLSFSAASRPAAVRTGIEALRRAVGPDRLLWIGGNGARGLRQADARTLCFDDLRALARHVAAWAPARD